MQVLLYSHCRGTFHSASLEQPTVYHERDRDIEILYREKIGDLTMKCNYAKNFCLQAAAQNLLSASSYIFQQKDKQNFVVYPTSLNRDQSVYKIFPVSYHTKSTFALRIA